MRKIGSGEARRVSLGVGVDVMCELERGRMEGGWGENQQTCESAGFLHYFLLSSQTGVQKQKVKIHTKKQCKKSKG